MIYILIALALFMLDWNIKNYIEQHHQIGYKKDILKGKVTVKKQYNKGFCLNVLDNRIDIVKKVSALVFGALVLMFLLILPQRQKVLKKLGLSLCVGGAASNVLDRFKRGYVVDYFSLNFKPIKHIVFNLADAFIIIGSIIVSISSLFNVKECNHINNSEHSLGNGE